MRTGKTCGICQTSHSDSVNNNNDNDDDDDKHNCKRIFKTFTSSIQTFSGIQYLSLIRLDLLNHTPTNK